MDGVVAYLRPTAMEAVTAFPLLRNMELITLDASIRTSCASAQVWASNLRVCSSHQHQDASEAVV
jgi:hypothetical protein